MQNYERIGHEFGAEAKCSHFCSFRNEVNYEIRDTLVSCINIFFRFEGECARGNVSKYSCGNLLAAALRGKKKEKTHIDRIVNGDLRSHASIVNALAGQYAIFSVTKRGANSTSILW